MLGEVNLARELVAEGYLKPSSLLFAHNCQPREGKVAHGRQGARQGAS